LSEESAREAMRSLQEKVSTGIIGQARLVERLIIGLLANGNLLIEGLPGLAKTRAVKMLAKHLDAEFSRIQFTPDLLPADLTGTELMHSGPAGPEFRFNPGPIFANLVLADEVNRSPAKVQAALLEAMEERQVTVAGSSHRLPELFMVMATQNPIEQEGTYPLPEAQMDRFLMHLHVGYGTEEAEGEIIRLVRDEARERRSAGNDSPPGGHAVRSEPVSQVAVFEARRAVGEVEVAQIVERYMVDLVFATRYPDRYEGDLKHWIRVGASPRAALALDRTARARAWLAGRDHVIPDDVRDVAPECLRHRLSLGYEAVADGVSAGDVVEELLKQVSLA
jgi:MoxR-like ATPase